MSGGTILFIDDDAAMRRAAEQWFDLAGLQTQIHSSPIAALKSLTPDFDGAIVSDVRMPGFDGLQLLRSVHAIDAEIPVILITGHGDVALAVEAMQTGAHDFLEKPFDPQRALDRVRRAIALRALIMENRKLKAALAGEATLESRLIGSSPVMMRLRREIEAIAPTDAGVLIVGETGTGKEVVARALHDLSPRANKPFVAINTAALPDTMAEAELFGHEKGAFTGADQRRTGLLVHAEGGTVFLDEITSMAPALQAKLLRALENREVMPLGSNKPVPVSIRVIAAANEMPERAVQEGRMRADLLYRLDVIRLELPPLRDRREDVPGLFLHFATLAASRYQRPVPENGVALAALFSGRDFPGNVRELKNLAERFVLTGGLLGQAGATPVETSLKARLEAFERGEIEEALARHDGNIGAVLEELDLPRRTLNEKMQRLGVRRPKDTSGGEDQVPAR